MGKLNLNFSYTFNGKIWNIISHPQQELLLLEVRQHDKFITTFSLIETESGKFLMRDATFDEKWWIGASHITGDIILFHVYPDQGNPEVKDMFAYNFMTEKILWKKENENIVDVNAHLVSVWSPEADGTKYFDVLSGEEIMDPAPGKVEREKKNKKQEASFHYREGSQNFDTVAGFLKEKTGNIAVKGIDYYENNVVIVISYYYSDENGKLDNDLLVVDHQGEQLLKIRLGNALHGISNDTFFIYYNKLIFVKNNTDFLIYQLPSI